MKIFFEKENDFELKDYYDLSPNSEISQTEVTFSCK